MKKIILTLALVLSVQSCFAYIEEGKTMDIGRMQNSGYSQAVLKVMDRSIEQAQGVEQTYVRYYQDYTPKNPISAFYTRAKIYLDPATDDDFFGRHELDFNNAWFPDLHDSTVRKNPDAVENL